MYAPNPTPQDINQLTAFIENELQKIRYAINDKIFIPLSVSHEAPLKPKPGLYAADGTNWNPGSGAGVYYYDGSTYTKL